jgi:hypothetical protein
MIDFPTSFGAIPNPVSFGVGFISDLQLAIAAWLGVAAVAYAVLLAVALRRTAREQVEITPETVELRDAA